MKRSYITFDPYYTVNEYNKILTAAKNNNVKYDEFLRLKSPHYRFLLIEDKDIPKFVDFDFATKTDVNWLLSIIKPRNPNEEYQLLRRPGRDNQFWNYTNPTILQDLNKKDYICVFKAVDNTEPKLWSESLYGDKIHVWGRSEIGKYNILICFNPHIKNIIPNSRILLEFDNSIENSVKNNPKREGSVEYRLNHFVLIKEKLMNKTLDLPFFKNGNISQLAVSLKY